MNKLFKILWYSIPFLGILSTFFFRLSNHFAIIKEHFSVDIKVEIDLAFNMFVLYIVYEYVINKIGFFIINVNLLDSKSQSNSIVIDNIGDPPIVPIKSIDLQIEVMNGGEIAGDLYLVLKYSPDVEVTLDNLPDNIEVQQNHKDKTIKIKLNTVFNFELESNQKKTLHLKMLPNDIFYDFESSIEAFIDTESILDNFKHRGKCKALHLNIKQG